MALDTPPCLYPLHVIRLFSAGGKGETSNHGLIKSFRHAGDQIASQTADRTSNQPFLPPPLPPHPNSGVVKPRRTGRAGGGLGLIVYFGGLPRRVLARYTAQRGFAVVAKGAGETLRVLVVGCSSVARTAGLGGEFEESENRDSSWRQPQHRDRLRV